MLTVVLIYQQIENSVLTPTIQRKAVKLSAFFIIVAVALFGALLGVVGALIAVPVAATIQIVLGEVTKTYRAQVAAGKLEAGHGLGRRGHECLTRSDHRQRQHRDRGRGCPVASAVEAVTPFQDRSRKRRIVKICAWLVGLARARGRAAAVGRRRDRLAAERVEADQGGPARLPRARLGCCRSCRPR